jgi:uncharacterized membrane protein (DUF2068 family)
VEHLNKHKRTLGILFLCYAILKIVLFTIGIQIVSVALEYLADEAEVKFAAYILKYVVGVIIILFTIPSMIAGIGLINGKKWALILALIMGIISLPVFPLGTAIGVYAIIVFLMDHSEAYKQDHPQNSDTQTG